MSRTSIEYANIMFQILRTVTVVLLCTLLFWQAEKWFWNQNTVSSSIDEEAVMFCALNGLRLDAGGISVGGLIDSLIVGEDLPLDVVIGICACEYVGSF